jgi:uncharacterized SAM-binding protein YcdF (DUF218 family)
MDWTLCTIAKSLIMPPGGLILLLLLGFFLVRGVLGRILIFVGASVFLLMSLPAVAQRLMVGLEPYPALAPDSLAETGADGILILGGGRYAWAPEYGGDTVAVGSLQRLRYGAFLHRRSGLPIYITGGSPAHRQPSVGRLMAQVLEQDYGISAKGVEDQSLTTEENAVLSLAMLERDGIRRVLLVSDAWHLPRAIEAFARVGIAAIPAPTAFVHREDERGTDYRDWLPSAAAFSNSYRALHEYLGRIWYRLKPRSEKTPETAGMIRSG